MTKTDMLHQIYVINQDTALSEGGKLDCGWTYVCTCGTGIQVADGYASKDRTAVEYAAHASFHNNTTRDIVPSAYAHRTLADRKFEGMEGNGYDVRYVEEWRRVDVPPEEAEVVSSELLHRPGVHTIMLDIDIEAELRQSATAGHYHLYIDKKLPWRRYKKLLKALMKAGVIEESWYKVSVRSKATYLRLYGK